MSARVARKGLREALQDYAQEVAAWQRRGAGHPMAVAWCQLARRLLHQLVRHDLLEQTDVDSLEEVLRLYSEHIHRLGIASEGGATGQLQDGYDE